MKPSSESFLAASGYRYCVSFDTLSFFQNDEELAGGIPIHDSTEHVKDWAWRNSYVFSLNVPGSGKVAIKLFPGKIDNLAVRYGQIIEALRTLDSRHFIKVEFREGPEHGALFGEHHTPYLRMEHVDGVPLRVRVLELVHQGGGEELADLADQWKSVALMMEKAQIAHGNINGDNLMVDQSGTIRLVDLDTLFVPGMRPLGLKSIADGSGAWNFPIGEQDSDEDDGEADRSGGAAENQALHASGRLPFDERLDRFPALVLYLTLLAGCKNPELFGSEMHTDVELLFSGADFSSPETSSLLQVLAKSPDSRVASITKALITALRGTYDEIPSLSSLVDHHSGSRSNPKADSANSSRKSRHPDSNSRASRPPPDREDVEAVIDPSAALRDAIAQADRKKAETGLYHGQEELTIVSCSEETPLSLGGTPNALRNRVEAARERLAAYMALRTAVASDDDELIAPQWALMRDFEPAQENRSRSEVAVARMKVLGDFLNRQALDATSDQALIDIWSARSDMNQCRPANKPMEQLGGKTAMQRARLAEQIVAALAEFKPVFQKHEPPPFDEQGENALIEFWNVHEPVLTQTPAGAAYHKRVEDAESRLDAWMLLQKGLLLDSDEQIANAWSSKGGILQNFSPAIVHQERAQAAVDRMQVISELLQVFQKDSQDEDALRRIASGRGDMQQCDAYKKAQPLLDARSWEQRIQMAVRVLKCRADVSEVLSLAPTNQDRLVEVWEDKLCRPHSLFAADLPKIDRTLELQSRLKELRSGIQVQDLDRVSQAWRDHLHDHVTPEELTFAREAMRRCFTGPKCIGDLNVTHTNNTLTINWNWLQGASSCYVAVRDGSYPEQPKENRPNAFQSAGQGGVMTLQFAGLSPHVCLWPLFRFQDEFVFGFHPSQVRLVTVEFCVSRSLFRKHRLSLKSLSGVVRIPELAVTISKNSIWPGPEDQQRIPEMVLGDGITLDLNIPSTFPKGEDLFLSLRPVDKTQEQWIILRPKNRSSSVIRL